MGSNNSDAALTPSQKLFTLTEDHRKALTGILNTLPETELLTGGEPLITKIVSSLSPEIEDIVGGEIIATRKIIITRMLDCLKAARPDIEYSVVENTIKVLIPQP